MQLVTNYIVHHLHLMKMMTDAEHGEIRGIEPYQFEPEVADDEAAGTEDSDNAEDLEQHRRDNTEW